MLVMIVEDLLSHYSVHTSAVYWQLSALVWCWRM